jgi:NADPH:quinone reductase-like Zn-dependent oxidoreductase
MVKAIRVEKTGAPSVMKMKDVDLEKPKAGEAQVRHTAIGLNFIDIYQRTGLYPMPLPFTPGQEGAGVVEAVGRGVTDLKPGDRVAYAGQTGSYSEAWNIAADRLVKVPKGVSDEQAASAMLKGMTAHYLLHSTYKVGKGDTILVHAAAGGVGLIMCQWAKALGATVIGTVGTPAKAKLAEAHGCDHPIIYPRQDFVDRVKKITKGEMVPVVYDSIGQATFPASLDCLRPRGMFVSYGNASGPGTQMNPAILMMKGSLMMTRPSLPHYTATRKDLEWRARDLFKVIKSGTVKLEINQTYALKDAANAHRALAARETTGCSVLLP